MNASISRIRLFKACRQAYRFRYIEGLRPVKTAEALSTGLSYHEKIEGLYKQGCVDVTDLSKESAMACAYMTHIFPRLDITMTEEWKSKKLGADVLIGRVDGVARDGLVVEHKTTSMDVGDEYEYYLQWDEQIKAYMYLTDTRAMYYTVCRKPTIRQKKGESDEDFFQRMVDWYDVDTSSKIRVLRVECTDEEIEQFIKETEDVLFQMKDPIIYKNTRHCNCWGRRCEYSSICLNYDPEQEYIEFIKE